MHKVPFQFGDDWFNPDGPATASQPTPPTLPEFREALTAQIEQHFKKVDDSYRRRKTVWGHSDATWKRHAAGQSAKSGENKAEYKGPIKILRKVDVILDEARFNNLSDFASASLTPGCQNGLHHEALTRTGLQPAFLTFHGSSHDAQHSISKHGFLLPGQQHPRHGYHLHMRVGNIYGDGVYSSTGYNVAMGYAELDMNSHAQMFVCALLPGKIQRVYLGSRTHLPQPPFQSNNPKGLPAAPLGTRHTPAGAVHLPQGSFSPHFESGRYTFAGEQGVISANVLTPDHHVWIAGNTQQIVPLAIITVATDPCDFTERPHAKLPAALPTTEEEIAEAKKRAEELYADSIFASEKNCGRLEQEQVKVGQAMPQLQAGHHVGPNMTQDDRDAMKLNGVLQMTHLCEDYYALPPWVYKSVERHKDFNRIYVLPRSLLFDRQLTGALDHHIRTVGGDTCVVYGSSTTSSFPASKFAGRLPSEQIREKRQTLEEGLQAAFDIVCGHTLPQLTSSGSSAIKYHVVHIFVDNTPNTGGTTFDMAALERLKDQYTKSMSHHYVQIKILFSRNCNNNLSTGGTASELRRAVQALKWFQYEGIFEQISIDVGGDGAGDDLSWVRALEQAEDELRHVGRGAAEGDNSAACYIGDFGCHPVRLELPYNSRFFNEGFVTRLDVPPSHDGSFTHHVVYKGTPPPSLYVMGCEMPVVVTRFVASTNKDKFMDKDLRVAYIKDPVARREARAAARQRAIAKARSVFSTNKTGAAVLGANESPYDGCSDNDDEEATGTTTVKDDAAGKPKDAAPDGTASLTQYVASHCGVLVSLLSRLRNHAAAGSKADLLLRLGAVDRLAEGILRIARHPAADVVAGRRLASFVAQVTNDLHALAEVPCTGKWFAAFQRMKFGRQLLKRISTENKEGDTPQVDDTDEAIRALSNCQMATVPIRVQQASASEIEPWTVVVQYVGSTNTDAFTIVEVNDGDFDFREDSSSDHFFPVAQVVRAAQLGQSMRDNHMEVVTDGLIWPTVAANWDEKVCGRYTRHQILQRYYSFVFTRNPNLVLRSQSIALRTVTFVRCVESILLRERQTQTMQAAAKQRKEGQRPPLSRSEQQLQVLGTASPLPEVAAFALDLAQSIAKHMGRTIAPINQRRQEVLDREKQKQEANQKTDESDNDEEDDEDDDGGMGMLGAGPQMSLNLDFDVVASTDYMDGEEEAEDDDERDEEGQGKRSIETVTRNEIIAAPSLCQVLGRLTATAYEQRVKRQQEGVSAVAGSLRGSTMSAEIPFDMLAESIVRLMHSIARSRKQNVQGLLEWLLGAKKCDSDYSQWLPTNWRNAACGVPTQEQRDTASARVDIDRSCMKTGKCFKVGQQVSNCSPFAVVATLALLERYAAGCDASTILDAFTNEEITMRKFLDDYAPTAVADADGEEGEGGGNGWSPKETQLALFLFAVVTHDRASQRPSFSSCVGLDAVARNQAVIAARTSSLRVANKASVPESVRLPALAYTVAATPRDYVVAVTCRLFADFAIYHQSQARLAELGRMRKAKREALLQMKFEEHLTTHRHVKVFSQGEVDALNEERALRLVRAGHCGTLAEARTKIIKIAEPSDPRVLFDMPYELIGSWGLLAHHSCFPDCPLYLQCLATAEDVDYHKDPKCHGNRRRGMQRYLAIGVDRGNYVQGWCKTAHNLRKKCGDSFERFVEMMDARYKTSQRYINLINRSEQLRHIYEAYGEMIDKK